MPAAAVTPAPIAYTKVAAVKKLVVELDHREEGRALSLNRREGRALSLNRREGRALFLWSTFLRGLLRRTPPYSDPSWMYFTVNKIECSWQAF